MSRLRFRTGFCVALLAIPLIFLTLAGTSPTAAAAEPGPNARALQRVMQVQDRHTGRLMALPNVVGTATGLNAAGQPVVKVFTAQAGVPGIPQNVEGVPVVVEVTGEFFALAPPLAKGKPPEDEEPEVDRTSRFESPVPIGVSVGNEFHCSAGTIGCKVTDGTDFFALSNVHVFDPWNYGGAVGERIVQPGRIDDPTDDCSGDATPENIIGKVVDSVPIYFDGTPNFVDAAIAIVPTDDYPGEEGGCRSLGDSTPLRPDGSDDGYGTPKSTTVGAALGQTVQKYGRTTGLTKGEVSEINASVLVGYSSGTALFDDQIIVSGRRFIKAGDSGSLLVTDPGKNPVGLLFAGPRSGNYGIANHIVEVLTQFGVTVDGE